MTQSPPTIDVLCVGHACYDLIFSVDKHPAADEKIFARNFQACGGGPAANAAVAVSRLGFRAAFSGYLGNDIYGDKHRQEFLDNQVDITLLIQGDNPTPVSTILVKPDGNRALINYKGDTKPLAEGTVDFGQLSFKTVLFDGHEPEISPALAHHCHQHHIKTVLDAGSVHKGTLALMNNVDYLVCSEKFALHFGSDELSALSKLAADTKTVVITLGNRGLIWQSGQDRGSLAAFPINAVDTTGAGDAFHGAFAAAIATQKSWGDTLRYASAAGALCCTKTGARQGLTDLQSINHFLQQFSI
jgi:sulfofructose kinase